MELNKLSNAKLLQILELQKSIKIDKAKTNLYDFGKYIYPNFSENLFHKIYYEILDLFAKGKIKKLIVSVPPQHGKSTGSTILLPPFIFGLNPNKKIAITSYSSTQARKFNRLVQRTIDTIEYHNIFPKTLLNSSNVVTVSESYLRNSEEFEICGYSGGLKAVGRGGALTGNAVDIAIMDDLYKDYMEGNSPVIRENVIDWYSTVVRTRLHNDSQQLIVFTRWHEQDLIGYLEKEDTVINLTDEIDIYNFPKNAWLKINFEAIKSTIPTKTDPREIGEALYPERHNIEKLLEDKKNDIEKFECLYQGNPTSASGRLYQIFQTYDTLPQVKKIKAYTDCADTGTDFMLTVIYGIGIDNKYYLIDLLYTDESAEKTEKECALLHLRNDVNESVFESNAGGRAYRRNVERIYKELNGRKTVFKDFTQTKNKESRIISNSATVNRDIILPYDYKHRFPLFFENLTGFKKLFKSNKDDAIPDVLTAIIEQNNTQNKWLYL